MLSFPGLAKKCLKWHSDPTFPLAEEYKADNVRTLNR